jgi:hypothetical protein
MKLVREMILAITAEFSAEKCRGVSLAPNGFRP